MSLVFFSTGGIGLSIRKLALAVVGAALAAIASTAAVAQSAGEPPPGANDWKCRPASAHPRPVILVHGTLANMAQSWSALSPLLKEQGYCVFALNYGENAYSGGATYGLAPIAGSARELAGFVARVLRATGAAKVDIVGHSQGGMMPRYYLKLLDGAAKVNSLIGIAPINHGTTTGGISAYTEGYPGLAELVLGVWCAACADLLHGSAFMRKLNDGGDTVPGVRYTVIASRYDDIVTPYESQLLKGDQVTNIVLQDHCPRDRVYHEHLPFDAAVLRLVLNALDPAGAKPVSCPE